MFGVLRQLLRLSGLQGILAGWSVQASQRKTIKIITHKCNDEWVQVYGYISFSLLIHSKKTNSINPHVYGYLSSDVRPTGPHHRAVSGLAWKESKLSAFSVTSTCRLAAQRGD